MFNSWRSVMRIKFLMLLTISSIQIYAGDDKEQNAITAGDWTGGASYGQTCWVVDKNTKKPVQFSNRGYIADTNLIAAHCRDETPGPLWRPYKHIHFRYDWGANLAGGGGTFSTKAEADRYWDERFQEGKKTTYFLLIQRFLLWKTIQKLKCSRNDVFVMDK